MRVLGISGSLRRDSHNTQLLRAAGALLPPGAELEVWEGLKAVPPYDADDDASAPRPPVLRALADAIAEADVVLFATPEYNHSLPGQLKNALDWISRPLATTPLRGKPVAVVGASTGLFGAVWAQAELRQVLGAIGAALTARGVAPERVATEAFGAVAVHASGIVTAGERTPHAPDGPPGTGPAVTFARSKLAVAWDDRYRSLLDLAEACDVPVGFGCRNGDCHNCESTLLDGAITYSPDPLEPPPDGRILVCCSRPTSSLALDL